MNKAQGLKLLFFTFPPPPLTIAGPVMDLLLLGAGMGIVGGLIPSPLHLIALAQVAIQRWRRAVFIMLGPPLLIDGGLLLLTFFFYSYVPHHIAHDVAYLGGGVLLVFGGYSLLVMRWRSREEMGRSAALTYASVSTAALSELTAPGTWIYWITVAGPVIAEGRERGYGHIVPFFAGGLVGYYGAAIFSLWLIAWGASLNKYVKDRLYLAANLLLLVLGISYLVRARLAGI